MVAKGRRRGNKPLPFWCSAEPDCVEGSGFIQAGRSVFLSGVFQALSPATRYTYLCMVLEAKGQRSFIFPRHTARKYGIPPNCLIRQAKALVEAGFIISNSGKTTREPNIYEFSQRWRTEEQK